MSKKIIKITENRFVRKIIVKITENQIICYIFSRKFIVNFFLKNELIILLYHGISDTPSVFHKKHHLNVRPHLLENHIIWLKEYFDIISPNQLLTKNISKKKSVLFTYDDGDKSMLTDAIPIMNKYDVPSINFINFSAIKNEKIFWPGIITYLYEDKNFINFLNKNQIKINSYLEITPKIIKLYMNSENITDLTNEISNYVGSFLTHEDLLKISKNKLVFMGNHLYEHLNAVSISDSEIRENYIKNHELLQKLENYNNFFAYPFGKNKISYDSRTNNIISDLGPEAIFLNDGETNSIHKNYLYSRIAMHSRLNSKNILISYIVLNKLKKFIKRLLNKYLK